MKCGVGADASTKPKEIASLKKLLLAAAVPPTE
jgi:hypothetical protein